MPPDDRGAETQPPGAITHSLTALALRGQRQREHVHIGVTRQSDVAYKLSVANVECESVEGKTAVVWTPKRLSFAVKTFRRV